MPTDQGFFVLGVLFSAELPPAVLWARCAYIGASHWMYHFSSANSWP